MARTRMRKNRMARTRKNKGRKLRSKTMARRNNYRRGGATAPMSDDTGLVREYTMSPVQQAATGSN